MSTQYCLYRFVSKHNVWLKSYLQLLAVERETSALALQLRSRDSYLFETSLTSYPLGDFRPQSGSGAGVPAFAFGNPPLRKLGPAIRKPDSQIFDSWFKSIIWIRTEKQMPLVNIPLDEDQEPPTALATIPDNVPKGSIKMTPKIPPTFDGQSSWFEFED